MTQSIDNSEAVMQGVVRDPITGALLRVNADGSINVSGTGGLVGTGTTVTGGASITLNTAGIQFNGSGLAGTATAITGNASITLNSAGLSFNGTGLAGTGVTTGTIVGTVAAATLNSAGLSFLNPEPYISSYENISFGNAAGLSADGASVSLAVAFLLPQNGSFSFIRFPVGMTTNSTTYGTTGASLSASVNVLSTWNVVIYSLGTGASSASLQSVASGSAGFTMQNSISVAANGTQYSITQAFSYPITGSTSSQNFLYSISNTNYSFVTTGFHTNFSATRFLDVPFAASLSAGPYWMVMGYSSASSTNSTGISLASNAIVSYITNLGNSEANALFRQMGLTNAVTGGLQGHGSFSTAGGGTTNSIPIANISAATARPYFQMLRSA